jgi:hypothetical protein
MLGGGRWTDRLRHERAVTWRRATAGILSKRRPDDGSSYPREYPPVFTANAYGGSQFRAHFALLSAAYGAVAH